MSIWENSSQIVTSSPRINTRFSKQERINTIGSQDKSPKREESRPNLQNKNITPRQHNTKVIKKTNKIPIIIINVQISGKVQTMTLAQRTTSPPEKKFNIDKQYPKRIHTSHSLLLLGDSHIRGLTEKISCNLANSFGVMGTIKPNADIMGITSSRYITPTNLTKHDIIIFYGGTRDISRNNSKNGLHALKEFVKRASNTNVILLEAPHRYDLPILSCVNQEVKLFNKRMQSLMIPFNHVKVINIRTEREHHTRNGLHLNKNGKYWIANNLAKEIKNSYLPPNNNPPIVLQWKNNNINTTQQNNAETPNMMCHDLEPPSWRRCRLETGLQEPKMPKRMDQGNNQLKPQNKYH